MKKLIIALSFIIVFTALVVGAENFCCNPETFVCQDCGFCPNVYGEYKVWDEDTKQMGTIEFTDEGAGVIGMKLCLPVGKSGKKTCYVAAITR